MHHQIRREISGDDLRYLVGACRNCNLKMGDPRRHDPAPRPRTNWGIGRIEGRLTGRQLLCLATRLTIVKAREVNRAIERRGGYMVRQVGSHRRYEAVSGDVKRQTIVSQHPGDIPAGTLRKIEKDMEPVFGEDWLR